MQGDIVNIDGQWMTDNGDGTYNVIGDISMTSQPPNPPIQPVNPPGNTAGVSSWLNSAGAFGVSIASLLSGKPATVQTQGGTYRTGAAVQQQQPVNVGALLLLGLGVLLLVKILK